MEWYLLHTLRYKSGPYFARWVIGIFSFSHFPNICGQIRSMYMIHPWLSQSVASNGVMVGSLLFFTYKMYLYITVRFPDVFARKCSKCLNVYTHNIIELRYLSDSLDGPTMWNQLTPSMLCTLFPKRNGTFLTDTHVVYQCFYWNTLINYSFVLRRIGWEYWNSYC